MAETPLTADLRVLRQMASVRGWRVRKLGPELIRVEFRSRRGQVIEPIVALIQADGYPVKPPSVKFLAPGTDEAEGKSGWPDDADAMFKTSPNWQPGPFICLAGIREYHEYPGHSSEAIDPKKNRLQVVCSRIQEGIDGDSFRGRIN